jgi:hypothetical protein
MAAKYGSEGRKELNENIRNLLGTLVSGIRSGVQGDSDDEPTKRRVQRRTSSPAQPGGLSHFRQDFDSFSQTVKEYITGNEKRLEQLEQLLEGQIGDNSKINQTLEYLKGGLDAALRQPNAPQIPMMPPQMPPQDYEELKKFTIDEIGKISDMVNRLNGLYRTITPKLVEAGIVPSQDGDGQPNIYPAERTPSEGYGQPPVPEDERPPQPEDQPDDQPPVPPDQEPPYDRQGDEGSDSGNDDQPPQPPNQPPRDNDEPEPEEGDDSPAPQPQQPPRPEDRRPPQPEPEGDDSPAPEPEDQPEQPQPAPAGGNGVAGSYYKAKKRYQMEVWTRFQRDLPKFVVDAIDQHLINERGLVDFTKLDNERVYKAFAKSIAKALGDRSVEYFSSSQGEDIFKRALMQFGYIGITGDHVDNFVENKRAGFDLGEFIEFGKRAFSETVDNVLKGVVTSTISGPGASEAVKRYVGIADVYHPEINIKQRQYLLDAYKDQRTIVPKNLENLALLN